MQIIRKTCLLLLIFIIFISFLFSVPYLHADCDIFTTDPGYCLNDAPTTYNICPGNGPCLSVDIDYTSNVVDLTVSPYRGVQIIGLKQGQQVIIGYKWWQRAPIIYTAPSDGYYFFYPWTSIRKLLEQTCWGECQVFCLECQIEQKICSGIKQTLNYRDLIFQFQKEIIATDDWAQPDQDYPSCVVDHWATEVHYLVYLIWSSKNGHLVKLHLPT